MHFDLKIEIYVRPKEELMSCISLSPRQIYFIRHACYLKIYQNQIIGNRFQSSLTFPEYML